MPLVKPNFEGVKINRSELTPGRYCLRVISIEESPKTDKTGNNSLVWKFEIVNAKDTGLNGRRISRWLPLGGAGAKILWRTLKCINPAYNGQAFSTTEYIGKILEADIEMGVNPETQKAWPKVTKCYPYIEAGSVGTTLASATADVSGAFNEFL